MVGNNSYSQSLDYNALKKQGMLTGNEKIINKTTPIDPIYLPGNIIPTPATNGCTCWKTRDASWQIAQFDGSGVSGGPGVAPSYRNDDWSTVQMNLGFNFCLYGHQYPSVFINNNGNVTFDVAKSDFSAATFPSTQYVMVAPFWGDVDTRDPASGIVYYKLTPTYMIIQWDGVGYYDTHSDKVNTFQLIMTNGVDPIIPNGNNVSFCYKEMQWTTGDASGGTNGFGGTAATVGANSGDGTNFIQFGTFDQAGSTYNGPNGAPSGVAWLNNQSFSFTSCSSSNNIPPIANGLGICDTVTACVGDITPFNILWLSPEAGQITNANATTTMNGFSILTNTSGNTSQFNAQLIAQASNIGYNTINFTAADNGTPAATTTIPLVVHVLNAPVPNAGRDTSTCRGPVQLNATGGVTYTWSPVAGLSNPSISNPVANPASTTTYVLTVSNGACTGNDTIVISTGILNATTASNSVSCNGGNNGSVSVATNGLNAPYIYHWSNGAVSSAVSNLNAGTYSVVVSDASGCSSSYTVAVNQPTPIAATASVVANVSCAGGSDASTSATGSGGTAPYNYVWIPTGQNTQIASALSAGTYSVVVSDANGCTIPQSVNITQPTAITLTQTSVIASCGLSNGTATINANGGVGGYTYLWLTNPVQSTQTISNLAAGAYNVLVADANGCTNQMVINISSTGPPTSAFTANPDTLNLLDAVVNCIDHSTNAATWFWNFGDPNSLDTSSAHNPSHTYSDTGVYCITLIVTDAGGFCKDTSIHCLRVEAPFTFYIPNCFTPNADGKNELFFGEGTYIKSFHILIFDRWGNKIFESYDIANGWDGKIGSNLAQEDVYVWKINIVDTNNKTHKYVGRVTLVR